VTGSRSAVGRYDREERLERRGAVDLESPIKGKWWLPGSDESVAVHGDLYDDDESTYLTTSGLLSVPYASTEAVDSSDLSDARSAVAMSRPRFDAVSIMWLEGHRKGDRPDLLT